MEHPNIEKLLENMVRDAKVNYNKTKKPYWLGKYEVYYEIYQVYTGKRLEKVTKDGILH